MMAPRISRARTGDMSLAEYSPRKRKGNVCKVPWMSSGVTCRSMTSRSTLGGGGEDSGHTLQLQSPQQRVGKNVRAEEGHRLCWPTKSKVPGIQSVHVSPEDPFE